MYKGLLLVSEQFRNYHEFTTFLLSKRSAIFNLVEAIGHYYVYQCIVY